MSGFAARVERCVPADRAVALGLLYRRMPGLLREQLVAEALAEAGRGAVDLDGLFVLRRRGRIVGAMLTQALAGGAAAVWAPEVDLAWGRAEAASLLVRLVLDDLRRRGFRLAQALLDASAPAESADDLARGGLPRITHLLAMARETDRPLDLAEGVPAVDWVDHAPEHHAAFAEVVRASYAGSLDMPELEGVRSLDDLRAGQIAMSRYRPALWRLGRVRGRPTAAAVVIMAACPQQRAWEIAYLGLTPEARGSGLGRAALAHALGRAADEVPRLELAVDLRNEPALKLYRRAGFGSYDRRAVHLARLQDPRPG